MQNMTYGDKKADGQRKCLRDPAGPSSRTLCMDSETFRSPRAITRPAWFGLAPSLQATTSAQKVNEFDSQHYDKLARFRYIKLIFCPAQRPLRTTSPTLSILIENQCGRIGQFATIRVSFDGNYCLTLRPRMISSFIHRWFTFGLYWVSFWSCPKSQR